MFSLTGLDGTVSVVGRTITVKRPSGETTVLAAESIVGAAVWTGVVSAAQFSLHYRRGPAAGIDATPAEFLSVRFRAGEKEWWDAMASAVMAVVTRSVSGAPGRAADRESADAAPAAPATFDRWLNRTIGTEAQKQADSGR